MDSKITAPHLELMCIIDLLNEELQAYKKTDKVSKNVIEKRSKLIIDLNRVLDNIVGLSTDSLVCDLYNEMNRLKKLDDNIDSFSILVRCDKNIKNTATINIDNFIKF